MLRDRSAAPDEMGSELNNVYDRTVGLCSTCTNAREVKSDRGSKFTMCQLSFLDPRFAKYPRLPVLTCSGHVPMATENRV